MKEFLRFYQPNEAGKRKLLTRYRSFVEHALSSGFVRLRTVTKFFQGDKKANAIIQGIL